MTIAKTPRFLLAEPYTTLLQGTHRSPEALGPTAPLAPYVAIGSLDIYCTRRCGNLLKRASGTIVLLRLVPFYGGVVKE